MRKIISLFVMCVMLAGFCLPASADTFGMTFLPNTVNKTKLVNREDFAYAMTKLISYDAQLAPVDTDFSDVKSDNAYSGYIKRLCELGLINGVGDNLYAPKDYMYIEQMCKVCIKILGYDSLAISNGGYPHGYMAIANELGLFKGTKGELSTVTAENFAIIISNILDTPLGDATYFVADGQLKSFTNYPGKGETFAEKYTQIYKYEGKILKADTEKNTIKVIFDDVPDDSEYKKGDIVTFNVSDDVGIRKFEYAPVDIVITDDNEVISIAFKQGVESFYAVVDSVNNDIDDVGYHVSYLDEITFKYDDAEYSFAEDVKIYFNDTEYSSVINLMGQYVKVITYKDEIIAVKAWDLKEGGIVTAADSTGVFYKKDGVTKTIPNFDGYKDIIVVADGELKTIKDLKANSVFYYYSDADAEKIVIISSSMKMSDKLVSINYGAKKITLGNITLSYNDSICTTDDMSKYSIGADKVLELCNSTVEVGLDPFGNVYYVCGNPSVELTTFKGYIIAHQPEQGLEKEKFLVLDILDTTVGGKEYGISEKCKFFDGITKAAFVASSGKMNSDSFYEFAINSDGEITEVSKPLRYEGFGNAQLDNLSSFIGTGVPYFRMPYKASNGQTYYQRLYLGTSTPIYAIYKTDKGWKSQKFVYSNLSGKYCSEVNVTFYGNEYNGDVDFVTLTGNVKSINNSVSGVVEKLLYSVNENEEVLPAVIINGAEYIITEESADGLKENMIVKIEIPYLGGEGVVTSKTDAAKLFDEGYSLSGGFCRAEVKRVDANRILFADDTVFDTVQGVGTAFYFRDCAYYKILDNGKIKAGSKDEINPGDTVVVNMSYKDETGNTMVSQVYYHE